MLINGGTLDSPFRSARLTADDGVGGLCVPISTDYREVIR